MAVAKRPKIFIFDASVFIRLNRINEDDFEIPKAVWQKFTELFDSGEIISHHYVYEEIVSSSKNPDTVSKWFKQHKQHCLTENKEQVLLNRQVTKKFPQLVKVKQQKEQADPWIIALAVDMQSKDVDHEYVIVTQESRKSEVKIPAAALEFGIPSITLKEFLQEKGISLTMKDGK